MARSVGQNVRIIDRSSYTPAKPKALGAMALVTQRGPIGQARLVESWPEFLRLYGDHVSGYVGTRCAKRALEGGCKLLVSRVVRHTTISDASTKQSAAASVTVVDRSSAASAATLTGSATFPVRLAHGDTLVVAIDGGSNQTATFNGFARRLTGSGGSHAAVTAGLELVLTVNGINRTVAFAGTENTAALYAAAINEGIPGVYADVSSGNVRITTDKKGSGAALVVHATSAAAVLTALGFTSGQTAASLGTSNVADIESVTAAEFETVVEAAVTGCSAGATSGGSPYITSSTTGGSSSVQVQSASTADDEFGFSNTAATGSAASATNTLRFTAESDGTWAHAYRVVVDDASADPTNRFRVRITLAATGQVLETHDNLSMTSTDPRYVVNVLRDESAHFRATDLASASAAPNNRPASGTYTPASGADGLSGLAYTDYLGDAATRTGLNAFNNSAEFRLASAPGVTDHDFHVAAVAWAAALTEVRYVGSIPYSISTVSDAKAFRRRVSPYASGTAIDSSYGALYAGWHKVRDARTREELWLPVEGELYAALGAAANDQSGGIWLALAGANRAKLSTEALALRIDPSIDDVPGMRDAGVNPVYNDPKAGFVLEGETTLQRNESALARLHVGILTDYLSEELRTMNAPDRWEPNDADLWRKITNRSTSFMNRVAAKRGTIARNDQGTPQFRVVCDSSNNTSTTISARQTILDLYYVPQGTSEEQVINLVLLPQGTAVA